jgi:signal transduction histidine kinase
MKLHHFIHEHVEEILAEWECFARLIEPAAGEMSGLALRDHAREILCDIALDIKTQQNLEEQHEKSQCLAPDQGTEQSAASIHGALRQASNFSLLQLSAEYRALRATVLRLWLPQVSQMSAETTYEMVRFNEAIDQALAESIVTYSARADRTRDLFLAILGHDLRAPLSTVSMAGDLLMRPGLPSGDVATLAVRVKRSARMMSCMVDDLLGFTRMQMGIGIPVTLRQTDIKSICESAVEDARATYPAGKFELHTSGNLIGAYDDVRLHQLFANLFVNAAQHGAKGRAIAVDAHGDADAITVMVTNDGPVIPEEALQIIFQPLVQLPTDGEDDAGPRTSLGLGLFIAREIALAHGGEIGVKSNLLEGTTFTVRLPRTEAIPK